MAATYLAGPNESTLHSKTRLPKHRKTSTACVRTVLRRLGGLPEVRGNRSVYVDCPFARAVVA